MPAYLVNFTLGQINSEISSFNINDVTTKIVYTIIMNLIAG